MEGGSEKHTIRINDSIAVIDGDLVSGNRRIQLHSVTHIRFGWLPIRLEMFRIGDKYSLKVKSSEQKLSITMLSLFGFENDKRYDQFNHLLNAIWDETVGRLSTEMQNIVQKGETVTVDKCLISERGILLKNFLIEWDDLGYQKNYNRLTLNSKSNRNVWTNLYYTETDNVQVLIEFLDWKFGSGHRQQANVPASR